MMALWFWVWTIGCTFVGFGTVAGSACFDTVIDNRVETLLSSMTIDDMLGQMTQLDLSTIIFKNRTLNLDEVRRHAKLKVGSYLNTPFFDAGGGNENATYVFSAPEWRDIITTIQEIFMEEANGHPILYGLDSVHGAVYVKGSTIFGQQLNAAATFNPSLIYEMGRITARDTAAAGIPWIFAPILEISQNPLWPRTYETFGEDPYLVSVMADAIVRGLQSFNHSAACMKHVIGYSKTPTGHDRDGVTISDFDLLNYFAPPFISAIEAGVMSAMENYISINGVPVVANTKILQDLLRHDMGFSGMLVTDWAEINNLHEWHRVAKSNEDAVEMALMRTSLDMSMVPYNTTFIDYAKNALVHTPQLVNRIKSSARRILKMKMKLGLYEQPVPGEEYVHMIGQAEDRQAALELARESIVLLKNNNSILPLPEHSEVFLTGHAADNVGMLCGGWSLRWQGVSGNSMFPNGISIRKGITSILNGASSLQYFNGLSPNGSFALKGLETAVKLASASSYTIIAIGEAPYAEKPGDIDNLNLPLGQIEYVRAIAATGTKVILVLVEGRPRLLQGIANIAHAVIYAMLPGELGGQAIAEIIYGKVNPSGRIPITYPKNPANIAIPYNHRVSTRCESTPCEMEWNFGHGLSYTTFTYGAVALSMSDNFSGRGERDIITVTVPVQNIGMVEGKETVMLFLIEPYRTISVPEVKQLKKFVKIKLQPGETEVVSFDLTFDDWSVFDPQIGQGFRRVVEDGDFVVAIKPETDCDVYNDKGVELNPLCAKFTIHTPVANHC